MDKEEAIYRQKFSEWNVWIHGRKKRRTTHNRMTTGQALRYFNADAVQGISSET